MDKAVSKAGPGLGMLKAATALGTTASSADGKIGHPVVTVDGTRHATRKMATTRATAASTAAGAIAPRRAATATSNRLAPMRVK